MPQKWVGCINNAVGSRNDYPALVFVDGKFCKILEVVDLIVFVLALIIAVEQVVRNYVGEGLS